MVTLTVVEMPMAQGFGLTAIRSGTGMGVEVNSSGGSLTGKNTSRMLSQRLCPDRLLFESLAEEGIQLMAILWQLRLPGRSFLPVSCLLIVCPVVAAAGLPLPVRTRARP